MNEYQELLKELSEVEAKICPPQKELSEIEHLKAHFRFAFESLYSAIYPLEQLSLYYLKPISEQNLSEDKLTKMQERAKQSMAQIDDIMDNENKDPWEILVSETRMEYIKEAITSPHCGDCTAVACSCERCHAEEYYKIPYTANWGKHEGNALLGRHNVLLKQKEILEQAMKLENDLDIKDTKVKINKI